MKRYSILIVLILGLFSARGVFAQDKQTITLNDATPGIDVVVSTPPGTTGAVVLQLNGASVKVTDSAGNPVFQMADPRAHSLELHFAPGSSPHTITIERLPGVAEAYVATTSQVDLTQPSGTQLITSGTINMGQELDTPLSASTPGATLPLTIPSDNPTGTVIASFPGTSATAQIVDSGGVSVASLQPSQIDGLSVTLNSGNYNMTLLNNDPSKSTLAAVSVVPDSLPSLPEAVMTSVAPAATQSSTVAQNLPACSAQVAVSSVNLRSGPGTGYSVLNYGFRGDVVTVGGTNPENSWLLVSNPQGSGWMDKTLGNLTGDCTRLQTYNIPYRAASAPQIIIQQPATINSNPFSGGSTGSGSSNSGGGGGEPHDGNDSEGGGD